jgi:hypothetical protein
MTCKHVNVTHHQYIEGGSFYCGDCGTWLTVEQVNNSEWSKNELKKYEG